LSGSRMFSFITKRWNPLGGECLHGCSYCWAQGPKGLAKKHNMKKYQGEPRLIESICKRFKADDFVFVCDMCDLFGDWVPSDDIKIVLGRIAGSPAQFLLLTKNPKRYLEMLDFLPKNAVLGCTIESDRCYPAVSNALNQTERLEWMAILARIIQYRLGKGKQGNRLFVSVEPVLDFDRDIFSDYLCRWIGPWAVAVGYDNYKNRLLEPPLAKTIELIEALERSGITVFRKTLREAWNEL